MHALLRHLERVGFEGAPRVLGIDERGREALTFMSGITIPPPLTGYRSDDVLIETARLLRRYHDATMTFVPPPNATWWLQVGGPREGEVICHNDIAPWNTVVVDGHPSGLGPTRGCRRSSGCGRRATATACCAAWPGSGSTGPSWSGT